jgi:hypothetical protein
VLLKILDLLWVVLGVLCVRVLVAGPKRGARGILTNQDPKQDPANNPAKGPIKSPCSVWLRGAVSPLPAVAVTRWAALHSRPHAVLIALGQV